MAKFQNPGAFFLGTLVAQEQKFLKPLIENARKQAAQPAPHPGFLEKIRKWFSGS